MFKSKLLLAVFLCLLPALAYAQGAVCPDLTLAQRWVGYITFLNLAYVLGATLVALGIAFVFGGIIVQIVTAMRVILEVVGYALCVGALVLAWQTDAAHQLPYVMAASIGFGFCVAATIWIHEIEGEDPRTVLALYLIVWSIIAILFNEVAVGFLAVAALMGILGFSIGVGPGYYAFGFEREDNMPRAATTGYILLAGFIAQKLMWPAAPAYVTVFAPGAFWLGSFVAFTGMLIMSFRWYCGRQVSHIPMQILTVVSLVAAVAVGMWFNIVPLPGMAGTFLVLFVASKSIDFAWDSAIGVGFALMFAGGVLIGGYKLAMANPLIATHFLALVQ
jgi:hypothetical protein